MMLPKTALIRPDPQRDEAELRAFLGEDFNPEQLTMSADLLDREAAAVGDEGKFYRTTAAYLYDLTAFSMSGIKVPYLEALATELPVGARVLDYGCGIGSDGLLLLEAGYDVEFADFDNPSTSFLRWRLRTHGYEARIHDLDRGVPGGFDAAFAFDVIEHVPNAREFLAELEQRSTIVAVNLLQYKPHRQVLHYRLPMLGLVTHIAKHRLRFYRPFHKTSHFFVYTTESVTWPAQAANYLRMAWRFFIRRPPPT